GGRPFFMGGKATTTTPVNPTTKQILTNTPKIINQKIKKTPPHPKKNHKKKKKYKTGFVTPTIQKKQKPKTPQSIKYTKKVKTICTRGAPPPQKKKKTKKKKKKTKKKTQKKTNKKKNKQKKTKKNQKKKKKKQRKQKKKKKTKTKQKKKKQQPQLFFCITHKDI
ncbi:hypothetical protein, partial [Enterobacter hormaechei]|uniref:hypothetical protein n=1 Tax=Enterobacter hormaechei TaxID=158836 RepID=UPI002876FDD5